MRELPIPMADLASFPLRLSERDPLDSFTLPASQFFLFFVASFVGSFVDKARDKAYDKACLPPRLPVFRFGLSANGAHLPSAPSAGHEVVVPRFVRLSMLHGFHLRGLASRPSAENAQSPSQGARRQRHGIHGMTFGQSDL
mgnify:CR=1 FL=1